LEGFQICSDVMPGIFSPANCMLLPITYKQQLYAFTCNFKTASLSSFAISNLITRIQGFSELSFLSKQVLVLSRNKYISYLEIQAWSKVDLESPK